MNKEEQQSLIYQTLLQKNKQNLQIIRKYRKKSNNYHKRISGQSHVIVEELRGQNAKQNQQNDMALIKHSHSETVNKEHMKSLSQGNPNQQSQITYKENEMNRNSNKINQGATGKQKQYQQQEQASRQQQRQLKLPAINNRNQTSSSCHDQKNNNGLNNNRNFYIRAQISISLNQAGQIVQQCAQAGYSSSIKPPDFKQNILSSSSQVQNKQKKSIVGDQICQSMGHVQEKMQQRERYSYTQIKSKTDNAALKPIRKGGHLVKIYNTHSVRQATIDPQISLESEDHKSGHKNDNSIGANILSTKQSKKQGRGFNSHKALLNLQQIVFQSSNRNLGHRLKDNHSYTGSTQNIQQCVSGPYNRAMKLQRLNEKPKAKVKNKTSTGSTAQNKHISRKGDQNSNQIINKIYTSILHSDHNQTLAQGDTNSLNKQYLANITNTAHNSLDSATNTKSVAALSCIHVNSLNNGNPQIATSKNQSRRDSQEKKQGNLKSNISIMHSSTPERAIPSSSTENRGEASGTSKQQSILPQLRRLKQFKLNFHKLARKEMKQHQNGRNITNPKTTSNDHLQTPLNNGGNLHSNVIGSSITKLLTNHNYSYSYNNLSNLQHTQDYDHEVQRKIFKIQAIPVSQIRWM